MDHAILHGKPFSNPVILLDEKISSLAAAEQCKLLLVHLFQHCLKIYSQYLLLVAQYWNFLFLLLHKLFSTGHSYLVELVFLLRAVCSICGSPLIISEQRCIQLCRCFHQTRIVSLKWNNFITVNPDSLPETVLYSIEAHAWITHLECQTAGPNYHLLIKV